MSQHKSQDICVNTTSPSNQPARTTFRYSRHLRQTLLLVRIMENSLPTTSSMSSDTANNNSSLNYLPYEIILIVCEHLPQSDISSLRLTSKRYAVIGASELCRNIHVMFTQKSFQNMNNIARHPLLSKLVQKINYEALYLLEVSFDHYRMQLYRHELLALARQRRNGNPNWRSLRRPLTHSDPAFSREFMAAARKGWDSYEKTLKMQQHLQESNTATKTFEQAFTLFPNLQGIEIITNRGPTAALKSVVRDARAVECRFLSQRFDGDHAGVGALNGVIASIPPTSRVIQLNTSTVEWDFFCPPPEGQPIYQGIYSRLQRLHLQLPEPKKTHVGTADFEKQQKDLGNALRAAVGLKHLVLVVGSSNMSSIHTGDKHHSAAIRRVSLLAVYFDHLLGGFKWPKLRTLEVVNLTTHHTGLCAFLRQHATTLRVLKMDWMWMAKNDSGWSPVFEVMAEMNLETVKLLGLWGLDLDTREVKTYNMGRYGRNLCSAIVKKERGLIQSCVPGGRFARVSK